MHNKGKIYFNGRCSEEFGIVVEEVPSLSRPMRKHQLYEVPGRSGTIIEQYDAYNNFERSYQIWFTDNFYDNLYAPAKAQEIAAWLYSSQGYMRLEDDFDPGYYRLAYFTGPIDIENILQKYGRCIITFNCRPERYDKNAAEWLQNPTSITNQYLFKAKPLIKVEGSGNVNFTIQGQTVYIDDLTDYIYIDCDAMDCFRQSTENMNSHMRGSFPVIKSGTNNISKSSGITTLSIQPKLWTI